MYRNRSICHQRHPTQFEPSFLELNGSYDVANICQALGAGRVHHAEGRAWQILVACGHSHAFCTLVVNQCWATPRNLLWIFVEELAIEGELTCDLLNLFEGFKKWFTWEDLPLFTGNGRVQRDGLTTQAFNSVRYGYANPEYNGGDVGHGEVDDHVMRTIRLAAASVKTETAGGRRFVLVISLFSRRSLRWADGYYWNAHPTQWHSSQTVTGKAAAKRERATYNTSSQLSCSRT